MSLSSLRRYEVLLVLGFLFAVHLTATLLWMQLDVPGAVWFGDDFVHLSGFHLLLTSLELEGPWALVAYLRELNSHYPLLAHYPLALLSWLVDPPHVVARVGNSLYFLILLVSVYHIGRHCQGKRAGLLAAALVSLMPAVYGGWRTVGLDFPAMCLTAPAVLMLLRCDHFRSLRPAALFGLAAGLATLVKGQSLLFLVWPAAYALGVGLWFARGDRAALGRIALNAAVTVAVLALVTAVWWAGRLGDLAAQIGSHATGVGMREYEGDISLVSGVIFFIRSLPMLATGLMTLALAAVLPFAVRAMGRGRWVVLIWLVLPLLFHMGIKVRNVRYIFPLVPAMAVLLGAGLCGLRPWLRGAATALVGGGAVALWVACSLAGHDARVATVQTPAGELSFSRELPDARRYCGACGHYFYVYPRRPGDFTPEVTRESRRMAATLGRRHRGGERLLIYYTMETTNFALALQHRLPASRLLLHSRCDWATSRRPRPTAGWHAYLLFSARHGVPAFATRVAYHRRVRKTRIDWVPGGDVSRQRHLVLWSLDAASTPPPQAPFLCEFFPDM